MYLVCLNQINAWKTWHDGPSKTMKKGDHWEREWYSVGKVENQFRAKILISSLSHFVLLAYLQ